MKVRDDEHHVWRVSRRWLPWRRKCRMPDAWSNASGTGIEVIDGIIFLVLIVPLLLWSVVILLEMLLLLLVLPFTLLGRLLGSPWPVEVRDGWTFAWETKVVGWEQSERAVREIAEILRHGGRPWGHFG